MNDYAHVADRKLRDFADLLVAEIVLKFQLKHLLLPGREGAENPEEKTAGLFLFEALGRRGLVARAPLEELLIEIRHSLFFPANVERSVAADGKKPFRRRVIELLPLLILQLHKSLLNDIAGPVAVPKDAGRVLEKGPLKTLEKRVHLVAVQFSRLECDALHLPLKSLTRELPKN